MVIGYFAAVLFNAGMQAGKQTVVSEAKQDRPALTFQWKR